MALHSPTSSFFQVSLRKWLDRAVSFPALHSLLKRQDTFTPVGYIHSVVACQQHAMPKNHPMMLLWICTAPLSPYPNWSQLLHAAPSMGGWDWAFSELLHRHSRSQGTDAPCAPSITHTSKGDLYHLSSSSPSLAVPHPVIPWQHRRSATSFHYSFRGAKKCRCILLLI